MSRADNRLINIQFIDGQISRIPRPEAAVKVGSGEAKYVSNTIYRAQRPSQVSKPSKAENVEQQQEKAAQRRKNKNQDNKS